MTPIKGVCRVCQRVVSAEQVDHPFGNVRLNDHYVYEGRQKKLCEGSGRMAQPARRNTDEA